jgi:glycosyltransferase involved in cell wall biosynthesis
VSPTALNRLLIYSDRGGLGGAEQINHRLALALQDAGLTVAVAEPEEAAALKAERAALGIVHHGLPAEDVYDWAHPAPSLTNPGPAEQVLDATRPDLVLFADSFPLANLTAKQAAARRGLPYLVLVHCVQPDWAVQYAGFVPALPALYRAARAVIAVSADNLHLLRRHFGLPNGIGQVIPNGRPEVFFAPCDPDRREHERATLGIGPEELLVLSIGRLELAKGWPELLAALPRLRGCPTWPRLRLLWVGTGTLDQRLRQLGSALGGGQVRLLPAHPDVPALLDAADLLVHPARFEGMPLVVLEAMAKGLPIIATAVSGIPEALGDTGVLLAPHDAPGPDLGTRLADAICALAGDAPRRRQLGEAAHRRARQDFTEARMLDAYRRLIRRLLPC